MRAGRFGGISLLVMGTMAQGFPALAEQGGATPAPAAPGSAAAPAPATPAPPGSASTAPAAAPPRQNAPDIVELRNGGMYRGTISELVPDDHVVIVTVTGRSERFDMKDVKYAGPASQAPAAAPARGVAGASTHGPGVQLVVKADQAGITLYRKNPGHVARTPGGKAVAWGYTKVCTAPCKASVSPGVERLALGFEDKEPLAVPAFKLPAGRTQIQVHYERKSGTRVAGWILFGIGISAGTTMMVLSTKKCSTNSCSSGNKSDTGLLLGGAAVVALGLVSLVLAFRSDDASISVSPLASAALRHASRSNPALDRASYRSVAAPGLGLAARF